MVKQTTLKWFHDNDHIVYKKGNYKNQINMIQTIGTKLEM